MDEEKKIPSCSNSALTHRMHINLGIQKKIQTFISDLILAN